MSQLKEPSKEQTKIVNSILSDRSKCLRIDSVAVIRDIKIYCTCIRSIIIIISLFHYRAAEKLQLYYT